MDQPQPNFILNNRIEWDAQCRVCGHWHAARASPRLCARIASALAKDKQAVAKVDQAEPAEGDGVGEVPSGVGLNSLEVVSV